MTDAGFKSMVMPLCGDMYRIALRITGHQADAEDAVQDAMIRLWERRDNLDQIENTKAYAIMTARNCSLDIIARRIPQGNADPEPLIIDGHDSFETADWAKAAKNVIDTLPPRQSEVMTLRDIDGLSIEEIQATTGLTAGNIRVLLCRARNSVRKYFSNR